MYNEVSITVDRVEERESIRGDIGCCVCDLLVPWISVVGFIGGE